MILELTTHTPIRNCTLLNMLCSCTVAWFVVHATYIVYIQLHYFTAVRFDNINIVFKNYNFTALIIIIMFSDYNFYNNYYNFFR